VPKHNPHKHLLSVLGLTHLPAKGEPPTRAGRRIPVACCACGNYTLNYYKYFDLFRCRSCHESGEAYDMRSSGTPLNTTSRKAAHFEQGDD